MHGTRQDRTGLDMGGQVSVRQPETANVFLTKSAFRSNRCRFLERCEEASASTLSLILSRFYNRQETNCKILTVQTGDVKTQPDW